MHEMNAEAGKLPILQTLLVEVLGTYPNQGLMVIPQAKVIHMVAVMV